MWGNNVIDETTKIAEEQEIATAKTLETIKDPQLKKTFSRLWEAIEKSPSHNEVEEFKKEISKTPQKPEQQIFSFLLTPPNGKNIYIFPDD